MIIVFMKKTESAWLSLKQEIEGDETSPLVVPPKLNDPDKLITSAKQVLLSAEGKSYKYSGMVDSAREGLDIRVAPENVPRALRFMDTLIKLMRARGHEITLKYGGTYAVVKGEEIKIACREKTKIVKHPGKPWPTRKFIPTGILSFKSEGYHRGEWVDGSKKLEDQLSRILATLETSVNELLAYWESSKKREEEIKAQKLIEQKIALRKEQEINAFQQLLKKALRWQQATILRKFLEEAESRATADIESSYFKEWLFWARSKADWFDPSIEAEDALLEGVDRNSFILK
jgi:hypothetical protein